MTQEDFLVVGIGNPGEEYTFNRHNIGFRVIDHISEQLLIPLEYNKKKSIFGFREDTEGQSKIILLKPQTFANLSGESVLYLASFLKIEIKNIIIIIDNHELDFGNIKTIKGADINPVSEYGAINSLKHSLNSDTFHIIKFGIGPIPPKMPLEDFCLDNFSGEEEEHIPAILEDIHRKVIHILEL